MKKRLFYCLKQIMEQLSYFIFNVIEQTLDCLSRYRKHKKFPPIICSKILDNEFKQKQVSLDTSSPSTVPQWFRINEGSPRVLLSFQFHYFVHKK